MKKFNKLTLAIILFISLFSNQSILGQVTIGSGKEPEATLDIDGNLKIGLAPSIANASVLVRDNTTGIVGTAPVVPAKATFVQSSASQLVVNRTSFNNSVPELITWTQDDIISNNLLTANIAENTFTVEEDGMYELSGFINFNSQTTNSNTNACLLNVSVQILLPDGSPGDWLDVSASRMTISGPGLQNYFHTIVVPPALTMLDKGTKIRMVFLRPNAGSPHGGYNSANPQIGLPTGIKFSKGMKIQAL